MKEIIRSISSLLSFKERTGTVRYMFPAVVSIAALLGAAVISSSDASYVRLQASETTIMAGQKFSLDVYAYAHVPVNAVDITLQFDPTVVKVLGIDKGQSVLTLWTHEPTVEDGKVVLSGGTFKNGFIREHKIARINLEALQTGQSSLLASNVVLLAGDGSGTQVATAETTASEVSLYVYDENTSPESIGVNVQVKILTDIDGDGQVSLRDVSSFMSAWGNKADIYDFNNDGRMTFKDFSIILADFFFK